MPKIKPIKEERTQTGVKVNRKIWLEFKALAVRRDSTATEMLEEAMENYLEKAKKET
jgi:hypothetical protein